MSEECEPWNNTYELDGETERLLRRLLICPLTDEQVARFFLKEVYLLLNPEERAKIKLKMTGGASRLLSGFYLQPFSEAAADWEQKREEFQQQVNWSDVPASLQEMSRQRAAYILKHAAENGWAERIGDKQEWRLTERGKALIEQGGFYMR